MNNDRRSGAARRRRGFDGCSSALQSRLICDAIRDGAWRCGLALLIALLLSCPAVAQQPITVAAASDLSFALPEIISAFQQHSANRVRLVDGSSGNLFTQIQNGAPYDVF